MQAMIKLSQKIALEFVNGGVLVSKGNTSSFSYLPFHAKSLASEIRGYAGLIEKVAVCKSYTPAAWNAAALHPLNERGLSILVALEQADGTRPLREVIEGA